MGLEIKILVIFSHECNQGLLENGNKLKPSEMLIYKYIYIFKNILF